MLLILVLSAVPAEFILYLIVPFCVYLLDVTNNKYSPVVLWENKMYATYWLENYKGNNRLRDFG